MIVLDASLLANAIGDDEEAGTVARAVLGTERNLAAPDLVDVDTTAVLRRRWLAESLSAERFEQAVGDLVDLPLTRFPALPLMRRAFELRANVTPYDACYVALAEALECPLWTADRRLVGAPGPRCRIELLSVE